MTVVASAYPPQANNLYETPAWVTRSLLRHFRVDRSVIWEPAAGNHKMVDVLRSAGAGVYSSDVMVYTRPHDGIIDFLDARLEPGHFYTAIVTNPPYGAGNRMAAKFARLALKRCPGLVAMLMTAKFDFGKTRSDLFADNPRFCAKVALVDRIQWFPGDHEGTEDHCWLVWAPEQFAGAKPRIIYERNDGADRLAA